MPTNQSMPALSWRKSSRSGNEGQCVEVAEVLKAQS